MAAAAPLGPTPRASVTDTRLTPGAGFSPPSHDYGASAAAAAAAAEPLPPHLATHHFAVMDLGASAAADTAYPLHPPSIPPYGTVFPGSGGAAAPSTYSGLFAAAAPPSSLRGRTASHLRIAITPSSSSRTGHLRLPATGGAGPLARSPSGILHPAPPPGRARAPSTPLSRTGSVSSLSSTSSRPPERGSKAVYYGMVVATALLATALIGFIVISFCKFDIPFASSWYDSIHNVSWMSNLGVGLSIGIPTLLLMGGGIYMLYKHLHPGTEKTDVTKEEVTGPVLAHPPKGFLERHAIAVTIMTITLAILAGVTAWGLANYSWTGSPGDFAWGPILREASSMAIFAVITGTAIPLIFFVGAMAHRYNQNKILGPQEFDVRKAVLGRGTAVIPSTPSSTSSSRRGSVHSNGARGGPTGTGPFGVPGVVDAAAGSARSSRRGSVDSRGPADTGFLGMAGASAADAAAVPGTSQSASSVAHSPLAGVGVPSHRSPPLKPVASRSPAAAAAGDTSPTAGSPTGSVMVEVEGGSPRDVGDSKHATAPAQSGDVSPPSPRPVNTLD